MLTAEGDAVIFMVSDLQDPPELIPQFIEKWEAGYKIVLGQKTKSKENFLMYNVRKLFYKMMRTIVDDNTEQLNQCTGFGLYDKEVIEIFRTIKDPYPYLRGLICEVGFDKTFIQFTQPKRKSGFSKNKFYTTTAAIVSKGFFKNAVTMDDIVNLCKRNGTYQEF